MNAAMHPSFEREILSYYEKGQEASRLETAAFRWEKTRTLDLLHRFLPSPPAVILDVGGGAGAYAFPLVEQRYTVHLIDPVPLHIEQARQRAQTSPAAPETIQVGDARSLRFNDDAANAVLLFGPLYHLTEREDRLAAIREARRVLGQGGTLMAVAISRFASSLDGIGRGMLRDPQFARIAEQDLKDGQHRNDTGEFHYFTTAFFHHPDEFYEELKEGGFAEVTLRGIEGPVWAPPEPASAEEDQRRMQLMRLIETDSTLMGASAHIMAVATKR
jgi:ubiquinone/menaquinone biosynthesis C-methylase UbiE